MASSRTFILFSIAILSLLPLLSCAVQPESVNNAAEILSQSGYIAMSLTLQLLSGTSIFNASFSTIFSPTDDAFSISGQPSLSVLQLHFSPVAYSFQELQLLPFGSKIPTLFPGRSLTVTTLPVNGDISIDNVKVDGSPVYNDGNLIVFAVDQFFDLNFQVSRSSPSPSPNIMLNTPTPSPSLKIPPRSPITSPSIEIPPRSPITSPSIEIPPRSPITSPSIEIPPPSPITSPSIEISPPSPIASSSFECPVFSGDRMFTEAGKRMRSEGFSIMASFLDMQLVQFDDADTPFTLFAPFDDALKERVGNFTGWGSLFLQHIVPCEVSLSDLAVSDDGAVLITFMEGFGINVTRSGDLLLLNGVPVVFPDLYHSDRLIVHGIQDVLVVAQNSQDEGGNSPFGDGEGFVVNEF